MKTFKRDEVEYKVPKPTKYCKEDIFKIADILVNKTDYKPNDNLENIINNFGGRINYLNIDDWHTIDDGSIYVHEIKDFDIVLPNFVWPTRNNFTIAHEFGHYILHCDFGKTPIIAKRYSSDIAEYEANWFAAGFLMPKDIILNEYDSNKNIKSLAKHFDVSYSAMNIRLKELNLI